MNCDSARVELCLTAAFATLLSGLGGLACAPATPASTPSEPRGEPIPVDAQGQPVTGHMGQDSPAARTRVGGTLAAPALHPAAAAEQAMRERAGKGAPYGASSRTTEVVEGPGTTVEHTTPARVHTPEGLAECITQLRQRSPGASGAMIIRLKLNPNGTVRQAVTRSEPPYPELNRCVDQLAPGFRYAPLSRTDATQVTQRIEFSAGGESSR